MYLFNESVDIQVGEDDDKVFFIDELEPFTSSILLATKNYGSHKLYFKGTAEDDWYFWSDDGETPNYCNVKSGNAYCIVIGVDGTIIYYDSNGNELFRYDPKNKMPHESSKPGTVILEDVQKAKDREKKQLGSGAIPGTDRSSLDDLMGRLNELRGSQDEQMVAEMEDSAMAGDMNKLQGLIDRLKMA